MTTTSDVSAGNRTLGALVTELPKFSGSALERYSSAYFHALVPYRVLKYVFCSDFLEASAIVFDINTYATPT